MNRHRHRRGFTLIEVLAALMLIAIVLPAIMKGIALSSGAATRGPPAHRGGRAGGGQAPGDHRHQPVAEHQQHQRRFRD
jgi:prepilin-type N-terminal cleavage/methylation domain-containing protein